MSQELVVRTADARRAAPRREPRVDPLDPDRRRPRLSGPVRLPARWSPSSSRRSAKGFGAYFGAVVEPDALAAIRLTSLTAAIAVPLNLVFGLAAAWAIAKFDFPGKSAARSR